MNANRRKRRQATLWLGLTLAAMVVIAMVLTFATDIGQVLVQLKDFLLKPNAATEWYLVALIFLPLLGVPLSMFCIMAGVKFGFTWGMAVIGAAMFGQMLICYAAMHSYIKPVVKRFLDQRGYNTPRLGKSSQVNWAVALVAVPVLPYMVKNVLLASGTLPLRTYMLINWPLQMLQAVPYVMFSGAVKSQNATLMWVAIGIFLVFWIGARKLQKRHKNRTNASDQPPPRY
ncbi:hypothetical protein [Marinobacter sp. F4216]|uniref:hypothetical protein n=1 Tax=Marinobacter sp. F4216 TaxID=2874281 RepID=UPI001CBBC1C5|nr:hypothetical protein [Marinobacter sp. F4216]MBZ2167989.1 hypothetical protein [Marinobacter sp. F4216]